MTTFLNLMVVLVPFLLITAVFSRITILELNLNSCMVLTRALVPQMKARRWGRIIHISSVMGLASSPSL